MNVKMSPKEWSIRALLLIRILEKLKTKIARIEICRAFALHFGNNNLELKLRLKYRKMERQYRYFSSYLSQMVGLDVL